MKLNSFSFYLCIPSLNFLLAEAREKEPKKKKKGLPLENLVAINNCSVIQIVYRRVTKVFFFFLVRRVRKLCTRSFIGLWFFFFFSRQKPVFIILMLLLTQKEKSSNVPPHSHRHMNI